MGFSTGDERGLLALGRGRSFNPGERLLVLGTSTYAQQAALITRGLVKVTAFDTRQVDAGLSDKTGTGVSVRPVSPGTRDCVEPAQLP